MNYPEEIKKLVGALKRSSWREGYDEFSGRIANKIAKISNATFQSIDDLFSANPEIQKLLRTEFEKYTTECVIEMTKRFSKTLKDHNFKVSNVHAEKIQNADDAITFLLVFLRANNTLLYNLKSFPQVIHLSPLKEELEEKFKESPWMRNGKKLSANLEKIKLEINNRIKLISAEMPTGNYPRLTEFEDDIARKISQIMGIPEREIIETIKGTFDIQDLIYREFNEHRSRIGKLLIDRLKELNFSPTSTEINAVEGVDSALSIINTFLKRIDNDFYIRIVNSSVDIAELRIIRDYLESTFGKKLKYNDTRSVVDLFML